VHRANKGSKNDSFHELEWNGRSSSHPESSQDYIHSDVKCSITFEPKKISKEEAQAIYRKAPLDSTSLADFLKALDNVHDRLKSHEDKLHNYIRRAEMFPPDPEPLHPEYGMDNLGFSDSGASLPAGIRHKIRRRKVGVFNPEFKFFNPNITGNSSKKNSESLEGNSHL
jgi:hypothetical protein